MMGTITKEIKAAILDVVKSQVDHSNNGYLSTYRTQPDSHDILFRNRIRIKDNGITMDGKPIAKIHRRYASRRVNLQYKELTPTIEYLVA